MKSLMTLLLLAAAYLLMPSAVLADPVMLGQVDTFESGTTQGWGVGGAPHPAPPFVATGGPGGAGDHYLQLTSLGSGGPGSRLSVFNTSQWAGNYISAGVNAIVMDVNNQGQSDLFLRLLFADPMLGPPTNVAFSTNAIFLPAGSGWTRVTFLVGPGDLTAGLGSVTGALTNATELRLFHNPAAAFPGPPTGIPPINAQLGVDNITAAAAVPEPATRLLLGTGLTGIAALRKRRKGRPSEGK